MKIAIPILFSLITNLSVGQITDSSKFNILVDGKAGHIVPDIILEDSAGNSVKLSSFKGKTLYIDFWATWCGPCLNIFSYEDTLLNRLGKIGIDSNVVLIKICGGSPKDQWKSLIGKQNSKAINLYLPGKDYKLFRRYDLPYYPTYHLVDSNFTYLGTNVFRPNDENIDYFLLRATKHVRFINALKELQQLKRQDILPVWFVEWLDKRKL
jgi:thiol-disulfide isomerase/thioredoxin